VAVRWIVETVVLVLFWTGVAHADRWQFYIAYAREGQSPTKVYAPPQHLLGLPPTIPFTPTTSDTSLFPLGRRVYANRLPAAVAEELRAVAQAYVEEHLNRYPYYDRTGGVALDWAMRVSGEPTVTTTTGPRGSTTTSTLPGAGLRPVRFTFGDVGRHYPDSQEINWRTDNGERANQYYAWTRMRTLHFVVEPRVFRLMRDIPSCGQPGVMSRIRTIPAVDVGKFLFVYILRPMRSGQPYTVHPNYEWDIPQNWLDLFAACLLADPVNNAQNPLITKDILQLLDLRVENGRLVEGDFTHCDPTVRACTPAGGVAHVKRGKVDTAALNRGILNPRVPNKPLTNAQCSALNEAQLAHHAHAKAMLERARVCEAGPNAGGACAADAECPDGRCVDLAPLLQPRVPATQLAFESTARNVHEQTLFSLIHSGDIDPKRSQASVDAFTLKTLEAHERWAEGFNCGVRDKAPNTVKVLEGELDHARAHFLRALDLPGVCLKTICDRFINYCPCTDQP
jgi:hypothetical protein